MTEASGHMRTLRLPLGLGRPREEGRGERNTVTVSRDAGPDELSKHLLSSPSLGRFPMNFKISSTW